MFLAADVDCPAGSPIRLLATFVDSLRGQSVRLGWLFDRGWQSAKANDQLHDVLTAVLHVAACGLHLQGCVGARLAQGVQTMEAVADLDWSLII